MPNILPQTTFGFTAFGINLAGYLDQPGTRTQTNRNGFDNLTRRFICNTEQISTDAFLPGVVDYEFPRMFSDRILTTRSIGGPWSEVEVEYLGVFGDPNVKPPLLFTDVDARKTTITLVSNIGIPFAIIPNFEVPEVTVQKVYLQDSPPNLNAAGVPVGGAIPFPAPVHALPGTPPISIPPPDVSAWGYPNGVYPYIISIFEWFWVLRKRSTRIAGVINTTGALYEVTDSWKRVVYMTGEPIANAVGS